MKKPMVRIHNVDTDEIIDREMTDQEHADYLERLEKNKAEELEMSEKASKRKSALAKLAALGLTEDEIAAL